MKTLTSMMALTVIAITGPTYAQDKDNLAVQEAVEAATEAAERVAQDGPVMIEEVPAPPPPIAVAIPPSNYTREAPVPVRYGIMRPTQADYPAASWAAGHEGRVRYELEVDAEGKPTSCAIVESTGFAELDEATCAIAMERGEFRPQVDENDEPVAGTYQGIYTWRKREPEFANSFRFKARFLIDEKAEVSECEIIAKEGKMPKGMERSLEREPCPFSGSARRGPYRDENGVPVAKRITVELAVDVDDPELDQASKPED
jgi:TonB family protein